MLRQTRRTVTLVAAVLSLLSLCVVTVVSGGSTPARAQALQQVDLKVLLIGASNSDPVTQAWESALTSEGVPYDLVLPDANDSGSLTLPPLVDPNDANHGYYDGVVLIPSTYQFAWGTLLPVWEYESEFGVNQIDGYVYPNPALQGLNPVTSGTLPETSASLTPAGQAIFPALQGTVPIDADTYGYPSTVDVSGGSPNDVVTPILTDANGDSLIAIDDHVAPDWTTLQSGVSEMAITFDYDQDYTSWLVLAPSLIDWLTNGVHLGLARNYVEMNIDDTFTPDDAWDVTTHANDYTDADAIRMSAADVVYAAQWSRANGFRMDQLFNGGGSVGYQTDGLGLGTAGPDPLLAQFQATDPTTGQPYADDFGWISHTYDTPYLDVGCATTDYVEAELNENSSWAAGAPGTTPGTGGLGLGETSDPSDALGTENPQVFVPGNHSGLADLEPGTPATVDPPDLDEENVNAGGTLTAGSYEYAVTDQFDGSDSPDVDQSQAYVTAPIAVPDGGSVSLVWQAICHAANYLVYREVAGSDQWSYIGNLATPASATLPDNSSGNPKSTTDVTGGGEKELTFTDAGQAGTDEPEGWSPPTVENANESPWEQNPYFVPALEAVGITTVGADASKPYPDPPDTQFGIGATYSGAEYPAGTPFVDGDSEVVPRHPINIFYNASTEAQEVDEYNTLYLSTADGGTCVNSATTTCLTTPATFADIVNSVVSGMFQNVLSNDPEPTYVHQTNIMGEPPAGPATSGTPPNTPDTIGDGLLYSVLNPLLAEYDSYFTSVTPFEQPTLGEIGTIEADKTLWSNALADGSVVASEQGGVVTVTNNGSAAVSVPMSMPLGSSIDNLQVGQQYGGTTSGWETVQAGASLTVDTVGSAPSITSSASATATTGSPFAFTVTTDGTPEALVSESGTLPDGLSFTDNGDGTATLAGTPATDGSGIYSLTFSADNQVGSPVTQTFTLTVDGAPAITSGAMATFTEDSAGSFTFTATGYPDPTFTEDGTLPDGVTLNSDGVLSGTPSESGSFPITVTADNGVGSDATQAFTLDVNGAPAITSGAMATFTQGSVGSFTFTATGYPDPTFTEDGTLPDGVTLNSDGVLSGTPSESGSFPITVTADNGVGSDATQAFTLDVNGPPVITSAGATNFTINAAGSFTFTATGYPDPTFTEDGTLPNGVTLNSDGVLSGTPSESGSFPITVTADNGVGSDATQPFTLTVSAGPGFESGTSATFTEGTDNSFTVMATGTPPPTFTEVGSLPTGVSLTSDGVLSGTPTEDGLFPITITAQNGVGSPATQDFTLTVDAVPTITSAAGATFLAGTAGSFTATATGYPEPTFSVEQGSLPTGVTLSAGGVLSGTPTEGGLFPITIAAQNGVGSPATQDFTLTVDAAPTITSAAGATFLAGTAGSFTATATGYPEPTFSVVHGSLPTGVTLSVGGVLSGTPTQDGVFTVTLDAGNEIVPDATQNFTLTVDAVPTITSAAGATFHVGTDGTFTVTASGFPTPSLTGSGPLPAGVTLTDNHDGTATLGGSPSGTGGVYAITITADNGVGAAVIQNFTLTVVAAPGFSSSGAATFTVGLAGSFIVAATGFPPPSLTFTGTLPRGLSFAATGPGVATISGTPAKPAVVTVYVRAQNSAGTATQTITVTVEKAGSNTGLMLSSASVAYGNEQTLKFSVTTTPEYTGTPTGTVTVAAGGTTLCKVTLAAGSGSCSPSSSALAPGTRSLTAKYAGDTDFDSSASATSTLTVTKAGSSTGLTLSSSSVAYGNEQTLKFSVTTTPEFTGTPTGTVTVVAGTKTLCKVTLAAGSGSCSPSSSALAPGTRSLTAKYAGNTDFDSSTSAAVALTVTAAASRFMLAVRLFGR
jgi:hypothetical protein